jgi:hypothetical protein
MYAVPVPEFWRYIPPQSARARLPRYRVNKQAVVFRHSPVLPCLSGQQFFYPCPRLVAYIMPVNAFIFFHASYFISFLLSSPHYLVIKKTGKRFRFPADSGLPQITQPS